MSVAGGVLVTVGSGDCVAVLLGSVIVGSGTIASDLVVWVIATVGWLVSSSAG